MMGQVCLGRSGADRSRLDHLGAGRPTSTDRARPIPSTRPLNAYSWAGPYLGGNVGYAWGSVDNSPTKPSGFVGGVQAGYNWQHGTWVFGLEGDIQATGAEDTFAPWKFSNPGSVRCAAAAATRSTTSWSSAQSVSPSANCAPTLSA